MTRHSSFHPLQVGLGIVILFFAAGELPAGPRAPRKAPRLVLDSASGSERMVTVEDLSFAYFRRIFYTKAAPRSESPSRQRLEVQDRRVECACLRLSDWSKIKFKKLRQIEIVYPRGSRLAVLRLTRRDGQINELSAGTLFGAGDPFPPRFGATIDGLYQEFPLILEDSVEGGWPEETLSRILLVTSPPPRQKRSARR